MSQDLSSSWSLVGGCWICFSLLNTDSESSTNSEQVKFFCDEEHFVICPNDSFSAAVHSLRNISETICPSRLVGKHVLSATSGIKSVRTYFISEHSVVEDTQNLGSTWTTWTWIYNEFSWNFWEPLSFFWPLDLSPGKLALSSVWPHQVYFKKFSTDLCAVLKISWVVRKGSIISLVEYRLLQ